DPGTALVLHDLEQLRLAPVLLPAAGGGLDRRSPGVGLEASLPAARAGAAAVLHHGVADLGRRAPALAQPAPEHEPTADAGADGDGQEVAVWTPGAPLVLAHREDAGVVVDPYRRAAEGLRQPRAQRERVEQSG